jgi:hypothetical protein
LGGRITMNCYERNNCKINCGYKVTSTHESDNSMASLQAAATFCDHEAMKRSCHEVKHFYEIFKLLSGGHLWRRAGGRQRCARLFVERFTHSC